MEGIIDSMDMILKKLHIVKDREAWYAAVRGVAKGQTRLSRKSTAQIAEKREAKGKGERERYT